MKLKLAILASVFAAASAHATITAQISLTTAGNGVLGGLQNSSGTQGALVWGLVVDTAGDGFDGAVGTNASNSYSGGFSYIPTTTSGSYTGATDTDGQILSVNGVASDDVLFLSINLMATTTNANDGAANLFRPTQITALTLGQNGVATGKSFAVIWFDATSFGGTSADGQKYGMVTGPTGTPDAQTLVLPSDTSTTNYSKNFLGTETPRLASLTLGGAVPEPSTALLGMLGALGLLRRRR